MGIFEHYQQRYEEHKQEELTIQEYLALCKGKSKHLRQCC